MLVVIPAVLGKTSLEQVRSLLNNGRFVDGRLSAGIRARQVKQNEELQSADATAQQHRHGRTGTTSALPGCRHAGSCRDTLLCTLHKRHALW